MQRVVCGKKPVGTGSSSVKAVPRLITAFVSRLDIATTSQDLCDYLSAMGMKDVQCIKLVPQDGKTFKSAAFRVSCSDMSRELFLRWPDGCLLRDWYFKSHATDINSQPHRSS